jgi:hypothetical protein
MPVVITFDIEGAPPLERNRIQSFFERLGWQNLGGSSYRYPKLGTGHPVEDWLNHVVPALTLFRQYLIESKRPLSCFTLDIQSTTGCDPATGFGTPPVAGKAVKLYNPKNPAFGKKELQNWIDSLKFPYVVGDKIT